MRKEKSCEMKGRQSARHASSVRLSCGRSITDRETIQHMQKKKTRSKTPTFLLEWPFYQKPKNRPGSDVIGQDLGPSTLAVVPRQGEAHLVALCEELRPDARKKRRLERKLDRQRRANNPEHYDEKGRVKKRGKAHGMRNEIQACSFHSFRRRTLWQSGEEPPGWSHPQNASVTPARLLLHR
jgi:hypothetical protein